jgi:hypothetical protein
VAVNARREKAALLLAAGHTIVATARTCEVSERAVRKWLADPAFAARVDELRAAMLERAMGRMLKNTTRAATTLRKLLTNKDGRVQLGAAKAILEGAARLRDTVTLEQRIKALEADKAARDASKKASAR